MCRCGSRDRIVVSTLRCGRNNPGSNPGHGTLRNFFPISWFFSFFCFIFCLSFRIGLYNLRLLLTIRFAIRFYHPESFLLVFSLFILFLCVLVIETIILRFPSD